jgi:ankyrin repeat protein
MALIPSMPRRSLLAAGSRGLDHVEEDLHSRPLHAASREGAVEVIKVLLDQQDDELLETLWWDAATKTSWTPLLLASTHGHIDAVQVLLQTPRSF